MNHEILQDKLLEYVMASLTPEEEREIELYLKDHPQDAAYVRDMFEVMAAVAVSQKPVPLPKDAEESLLARIRSRGPETASIIQLEAEPRDVTVEPDTSAQKAQLPRRRIWLGFALAAAVAFVAYLGLRPQLDPVERQLSQICAQADTTCETISTDLGSTMGTIARRPNNLLFVVLKEDPPAGQVYQAWEIIEGQPVSLGIWPGRVLDISQSLAENSIFGITLEPPGGSPQPTSNPLVVVPLAS